MIKSWKIYIATIALVLVPALSYSMPWSWDFFDQPSHKGQEEKAVPMPQGTVPVQGKPLEITSMADAADIKSPVPVTRQSIERGRNRYGIYCSVCHGKTGKGDGTVGKKYVPPTDLTSDYVQKKNAAQIYYAITNGGLGIMPVYNDSLEPEDRWHIANYILNEILNEKE